MSIERGVVTFIDNFNRAQALTTTPGMNGWTVADTSSAGTPTYLVATDTGLTMTLAATSEAENVCAFQNDVLIYDLASLQTVWFIARFVAQADAVTTLTMGVGSARNDTPDSVAYNAWFRVEGSASTSNVVCETDDATTDNDDKASGTTMLLVYKKYLIDFTAGLANVRFFIDGARVAAGTTFDMSAAAAGQNVQPIIQLQKASGTGVPAVSVVQYGAQFRYAHGA
jgi:hypothetical protein